MRKKPCLHRGCPAYAEKGSYCRAHLRDGRSPSTFRTARRDFQKLRQRMIRQAGPRPICAICGLVIPAGEVQVDHKLPVASGGTEAPQNLRLTHRSCNASRR